MMHRVLKIAVLLLVAVGPICQLEAADDPWSQAAENGEEARQAFVGCWRFVQGWLQHADPESGLIPRNLFKSLFWNARDSAADNYPFMVLSTYYTDRALHEGRMLDMLQAEQRYCNRLGKLPDDFIFATHSLREKCLRSKRLFSALANTPRTDCCPLPN